MKSELSSHYALATVYFTTAKCLTAVSTKTFSEKNHPSWFDWSFIVLYTSLNESRSLKKSLGLALSFEIISSSIWILLTRITVSIPNPKSNEFLRFRFILKWYSKYVSSSSIDVLPFMPLVHPIIFLRLCVLKIFHWMSRHCPRDVICHLKNTFHRFSVSGQVLVWWFSVSNHHGSKLKMVHLSWDINVNVSVRLVVSVL